MTSVTASAEYGALSTGRPRSIGSINTTPGSPSGPEKTTPLLDCAEPDCAEPDCAEPLITTDPDRSWASTDTAAPRNATSATHLDQNGATVTPECSGCG